MREFHPLRRPEEEEPEEQFRQRHELAGNYFFQQLFEGYQYEFRKEEASEGEKVSSEDKTSLLYNESKLRMEEL